MRRALHFGGILLLVATMSFCFADGSLQSGCKPIDDATATRLHGGDPFCAQRHQTYQWECDIACCSATNKLTEGTQSPYANESYMTALCDTAKPLCLWYYRWFPSCGCCQEF